MCPVTLPSQSNTTFTVATPCPGRHCNHDHEKRVTRTPICVCGQPYMSIIPMLCPVHDAGRQASTVTFR